jgi:aspartate semialdehyde dehydrogenase (EC 1.2.1.11)
MAFRVAVVGATGAVGREILKTLAERKFPISEIIALASPRSAGQQVSFGEDQVLTVRNLETFDFHGVDFGLFSPGAEVSAIHGPRAAAAGCIVIDNTSQFRMDPDVPLVVPEVNPDALGRIRRGIIANPNCSTIQMVVALKPLHDRFRIKRVVVATYQSTSGAGKEGMEELMTQTRASLVGDPIVTEQFTKPIAFNVIPHIDRFMADGATKEEWKMAVETRKILDPDIAVMATCVRVPVSSAMPRPCMSNSRTRRRWTRRALRCAMHQGSSCSMSAMTAATSPLRVARRGCGLCLASAGRFHGAARPRLLVRFG